jgi:N-acetylmuramoyl-L-alanine amidase
MSFSRQWRLRDLGDDVIVEVWPAVGQDEPERRAIWEMEVLLNRALCRDTAAQRILRDVHAALYGLVSGRPSLDRLREDLTAAARADNLRIRRKAPRVVQVSLALDIAEEVLGPATTAPEPELVWIGILLVDQDGVPVPNRPYRVITPDGQTSQGRLDSHGTAFVRNIPSGNCQVFCPDYAPHGPSTYVVQPGDHISGIALQNGFEDYTVVWKHANNAALSGKRDVSHALNEGDEVYIPELKSTAANKPTGIKHKFTIKLSPLKLRVKLLGTDMKPIANAACTLDGTALTSDGDGVVEIPVDKLATSSTLTVDGTDQAMSIGRLNTVDDTTQAGWKARLFNLGFLIDPTLDDTDGEVLFALQDFQAEHSLDVSGTFDDATKSKLKDVHGC